MSQGYEHCYGEFSADDMKKSRFFCACAYLFFFLPLVAYPQSNYARFHANQGFVLTAAYMITSLVAVIIPRIGSLVVTVLTLLNLCLIVFGMYNALVMKPRILPLIGRIRLISMKDEVF